MTGNTPPWDPNNQQGQNPGYPQGQNPGYQNPGYQNAGYPQGGPGYGQQPPGGYQQNPYGQPQGSNKTPIIIAIVVVALIAIGALIFFLTKGGDDKDTDDRGDSTSQQTTPELDTDDPDTDIDTDPDTDIDTDPDTDIATGFDTTPPAQTPTDGGSDDEYGDPNADPAKFRSGMEDILADSGLTQEMAEEQGITPDQWDTYLDCVTDESLQRLTPDVIESISNGQDVYDSHSVNELADIATQCGNEAGTL